MDVPNLMQRLSQHFVVLVGHTNVATRVATVDDAKHQAMDVDAPEMHACMHGLVSMDLVRGNHHAWTLAMLCCCCRFSFRCWTNIIRDTTDEQPLTTDVRWRWRIARHASADVERSDGRARRVGREVEAKQRQAGPSGRERSRKACAGRREPAHENRPKPGKSVGKRC